MPILFEKNVAFVTLKGKECNFTNNAKLSYNTTKIKSVQCV